MYQLEYITKIVNICQNIYYLQSIYFKMKRNIMPCKSRENLKYKGHISKFNRKLNVFLVNDFFEKFSYLFTRSFIKSAISFFFVIFCFVLVFLNNIFSIFFPFYSTFFFMLTNFQNKSKMLLYYEACEKYCWNNKSSVPLTV